jgi:hypothetical protein
MRYFGYRVSVLYMQTKDGKTFKKRYEEKNSRYEDVTIKSDTYIKILNNFRQLKQTKPSRKHDTYVGYSGVITLFENNKIQQILIPNELIGGIFAEIELISRD